MVYNSNASTITTIYHMRVLSLYAHRPIKPPVPVGERQVYSRRKCQDAKMATTSYETCLLLQAVSCPENLADKLTRRWPKGVWSLLRLCRINLCGSGLIYLIVVPSPLLLGQFASFGTAGNTYSLFSVFCYVSFLPMPLLHHLS